jgi:hypothetical protein
MKKQLFLGFTAVVSMAAVAQSHRTAPHTMTRKAETIKFFPIAETSIFNTTTKATVLNKVAAAPYKRIGGAPNALTVIVSESRCLQYNDAIKTVGLTYRQNQKTWVGIPDGNPGTVSFAYSSNNGSTWDSTVVAASSSKLHRYPCGVMYNPQGNTTPSNAYAVASGPWHPGANWQGVFFAAKQLSSPGTNTVSPNNVYLDNLALVGTNTKQDFSRIEPQATADGVVHILGHIYGDANGTTAATQLWRGAKINKGVFNAGSFTWTSDSLIPDFKKKADGSKKGYTGTANMAWNEAGTIGYVIFYGVAADALSGTSANTFQPYVYKTTNSGATWSRFSPLFDFNSIAAFSSRVYNVKGTATPLAKPFITPNEGGSSTVDVNGNLHLFCSLGSASSDNIDSLDYSYTPNYLGTWNYLVDCITTSTGWEGMIIDSLSCQGPLAAESNWTGATNIAYDARCQISRTTDGKNLIYSWADSDSSSVTSHISTLPDIYMKGYDVTTNKMTCKKNMTSGKAGVNYLAYFFYASPIIAKPTASTFQIPTSFTKSDDGSNNGDLAISQYYIDDNMFSASEFTVTPNGPGCNSTGIGFNELHSSISSLNFYPSPASTNATIDVVLHDNAKMEIVILNSVGQTVYSTSVAGVAGGNKVDVNLSNLNSGLYFYQVKVANSKSVTKKFVIEK